jgi:hypothetical protein
MAFEVTDADFSFGIDPNKLKNRVGNEMANRLQRLLDQRLRSSGLRNRTGALANSLQVRYDSGSNSIEVGVLIYGVFNSYGVGPKVKRGKVYNIDEWVLASLNGTPQGGNKFSYQSDYRQYGIPARKWLPSEEALQGILNDILNEMGMNIDSIA